MVCFVGENLDVQFERKKAESAAFLMVGLQMCTARFFKLFEVFSEVLSQQQPFKKRIWSGSQPFSGSELVDFPAEPLITCGKFVYSWIFFLKHLKFDFSWHLRSSQSRRSIHFPWRWLAEPLIEKLKMALDVSSCRSANTASTAQSNTYWSVFSVWTIKIVSNKCF